MEKPKKINLNQQKIDELEAQVRRIAADYDNYKKRTEAERKELYSFAQAQTLLELAPVMDNFRRATEHLPAELQDNNWATGVMYVEKQLEQIMTDLGLGKIKTVGELFDPALHEAITSEASETVPEHHIICELEGGYIVNGRVLKPAKVKVSIGPVIDEANEAPTNETNPSITSDSPVRHSEEDSDS